MKALTMLGLMLGLCASVFAQTEAEMCVSVTDACCDATWSSVDYTIPSGQQISKTYIHYDNPNGNEVDIQCLGFPNGEPGVVIWELTDDDAPCNCGNTQHDEQIAGPQTIRFKIRSQGCNSEACTLGSTTVHFYTSAKTSCAPSCQGQ